MKFNPDEYEPVEERVKRFYAEHPNGYILTKLESNPDNMDFAVFSAEILLDGVVRARGCAQEIRDKELSKNKQGYEYESVNYTSWLENAETSAIGRALANFNYAGSKRPSREEMQKAQRRARPEPDNGEAGFLRDDLLAYLETAANVVGKANVDKLRDAITRHEGDAGWMKNALERTIAEVKRQEAVLAVNAAPLKEAPPNPLQKAMGNLEKAVQQNVAAGGGEAKQEEIF